MLYCFLEEREGDISEQNSLCVRFPLQTCVKRLPCNEVRGMSTMYSNVTSCQCSNDIITACRPARACVNYVTLLLELDERTRA